MCNFFSVIKFMVTKATSVKSPEYGSHTRTHVEQIADCNLKILSTEGDTIKQH